MLNELPHLPKPLVTELRALADKACDQSITAEECLRLSAILRDQPAAQLHYLAYMGIHARLGWEFGPIEHGESRPGWTWRGRPARGRDAALGHVKASTSPPGEHAVSSGPPASVTNTAVPAPITHRPALKGRRARLWRMVGSIAAAVAVLLACGLYWKFGVGPRNQRTGPAEKFATLTAGVALEWEDPAASPATGTPLAAGRYCLAMGIAEVTFRNGAVAVVEGPADLEILGPDRARVHSGQVVVRAEDRAKGFVLETVKATVVDLGTEFGVKVNRSTETEVDVFEGSVTARLNGPDGRETPEQYLRAGQAIHYAAADNVPPQTSTSQPNRFVRRLPEQTSHPGRKIPLNRSRFDSIRVAVAPPRMTIDGDLAEWSRCEPFRCPSESPSQAADPRPASGCPGCPAVEGRMMYDRDFLYIGAHVRDPYAMRNVIDPKTDADRAWCGGAIQVRVSTDRSRPWPLDAESPWQIRGKRPVRPSDLSDRLAHLTLWYYAPARQACLHITYGMDLHGNIVNPPGFRGAFRRDSDGQGYVAEYAIPWSVLGAAGDPPRGGDVLATSWNVHWSDDSGRIWQGHLVDIFNPAESGWTFARAATWGRAIYEGNVRDSKSETAVPR